MKDDVISVQDLEEGKELRLDFEKMKRVVAQSPGVIPVAVQNINTREVILIAYTNKEALYKSNPHRNILEYIQKRIMGQRRNFGESFRIKRCVCQL